MVVPPGLISPPLVSSRLLGDHLERDGPQGRITTPGTLRGMVEQCNTELNLGLFPEEVSAIAAVLHRDHYRAGWRQAARPASR